jgi:hypothetical protein
MFRARIVARRPSAIGYATADDLDLAFDPAPVAPEERTLIHAADLVRERALYTLHTPCGAAAALESPFLYAAALDHATGVLSVPFERLGELHPERDWRPCFVHSIGRTGSTLLVRLLRAAGFPAASEPDWFTQLCRLTDEGRCLIDPDMHRTLVAAGVASLAASLGPSPFIKLRSHCNAQPEALSPALAGARAVLMLRRRRDWGLSRWRNFGESPEQVAQVLREGIAVFDRLAACGKPPHVLWYEELVSHPAAALSGLIDGFSADPACLARIAGVMAQDAQAGTALARRPPAPDLGEPAFAAAFDVAWREQARPAGMSAAMQALLEALEG